MTHKIALTLTLAASAAALLAAPVVLTGKAIKPIAGGAFELAPGQSVSSAKLIPVDPKKSYTISGEFRSVGNPGEDPSGVLFGVIPFDAGQGQLSQSMVNVVPGTETELVAPVKKGAKTLFVKDASKWNKAQNAYAIAFDVKKDYADLPNRKLALLVSKITKVKNGWQIDFTIPVRADYPAGTKVREHREGGYCWCGVQDATFGKDWTAVGNTVTGEYKFGVGKKKFWKGTRYVKIVLRRSKGAKIEFRNLEFSEEK